MFKYTIKYEWLLLIRNQWIQVITVLLCIFFGFAIYNGVKKVEKRTTSIASAINTAKVKETKLLAQLDSIEKGYSISVSKWVMPTKPIVAGNLHPRIVKMPPKSMAFIAIGQSDIFTHYVKPKVTKDESTLDFKEMASPVQLLFGNFDLAFVIVYLLPLLIIAFSFDVLSSEREKGTLKILASNPINIKFWVLQKLGFRFLGLVIIIGIVLSLVLLIFNFDFRENQLAFINLMFMISVYTLFWFILAFAVNIYINNSAKNAITLIGSWILFVLLLPSIINQLSNTLYPMPSRLQMLNEMRIEKAEATKKQDEILDNFLRDHPELAIKDTAQADNFYQKYLATQQLVKDKIEPLVSKFETQLDKQHKLVNATSWFSPALIVQNSLNQIAGTSEKDYQNFRGQSIAFSKEWRNYFIPMLFKNQKFKKSAYETAPKFEFKYAAIRTLNRTFGLLFLNGILLVLVLTLNSKKTIEITIK